MLTGRKQIGVSLKFSSVKELGSENEVNLEIFLAENLEEKNSFNGRHVMYDVLAIIPPL
jgi:transposase